MGELNRKAAFNRSVTADTWDEQALLAACHPSWDTMLENLEDDFGDIGLGAAADIFILLYGATPARRLTEPGTWTDKLRGVIETPGWSALYGKTIGDSFAAQASACAMEAVIRNLCENAREQGPFRGGPAGVVVEPGPAVTTDNGLDPERTGEELETLIAAALLEALESLAREHAMAASFGSEPGELRHLDPFERIAAAERLSTPKMQQIAAEYGQLQAGGIGGKAAAYGYGGYESGGDLSRLAGSEVMRLAVPELQDLFFASLAERQLAVYAPSEGTGKEGPIILLEDGSSSMHWEGGVRHIRAKAFALKLAEIAHNEGRWFALVMFGGISKTTVRVYPNGPGLIDRLDIAELAYRNAGTDYNTAFNRACDIVDSSAGLRPDIVMLTDGEGQLNEATMERLRTQFAERATRIHLIDVAGGGNPQLAELVNETGGTLVDDDIFEGADA